MVNVRNVLIPNILFIFPPRHEIICQYLLFFSNFRFFSMHIPVHRTFTKTKWIEGTVPGVYVVTCL